MFESALLESSVDTPRVTSIWTKGLSFVLELLLLSFAVLAPLLYTEALPEHVLSGILAAPALPPAAPPPRANSVAARSQARSELHEGHIMLPAAIPQHAREIHDEVTDNPGPAGYPVGVVGAPPNGSTPNGTIASLLDALPPVMPKNISPHSVRVSSGVAQGLLIHQVRPQYPVPARNARIQGTVLLQATIGRDGAIQNLRLISGHPFLTQAAMDAVRQWRYRPYLLNHEPGEVDTTIQVNFTLSETN